MRILLSTDTVGGVWDHAVTLARALGAAGHEVLVAALGEPRDVRLARLPEGVEYTWRDYRLEWMPDAGDDVRASAEWLAELAALWQADVVHLNQMAVAAHPFPAPVLVAVHSDVLSWWRGVHGRDAPRDEWAEYAEAVREGIGRADAVVAPTRWQAGQVTRFYGRADVHVVHNGVEAPADPPPPRDGFHVVSVGRMWDRGKGMDVLDEAAGLLRGEVAIHVLGEATAPHGGAFVPRHLDAQGRVERAGVDRWMRRASVYAAPSRYEPFGLAPLEAALNGCALVLSDLESFRELWDGCACFVPVGDAAALADALRALRDDPRRRASLAGGARRRALRRFGAARMADGYLGLYATLAAARPAAAGVGG
ncbi:MAG TPA: glycosyltransferase family 4 protein [Longimicrobium sp.]|nr:glycosyltransferase family 4 protein [Longimicrobium sp.]